MVTREPYRDGRKNSWTGTGFMQVLEHSILNFTVDGLRRSMFYDIMVRYEPKFPGNWDDAQIIIERDGPPDLNGPCAEEWTPDKDRLYVQLPSNQRSSTAVPGVCLEANKVYSVLLELKNYGGPTDTPTASILIDSVCFF